MNDDLHEAILRMAAALEGATDVMSRLVVALECLKECQDDDEYDGDRESLEDADMMALELANKTRWRFYSDHLNATGNGSVFRAGLLREGYRFDRGHVNHDIPWVTGFLTDFDFYVDLGAMLLPKEIVFDNFLGTAYGCVIFNDIGLIAYYEFPKPAVGDGGLLTICSEIPTGDRS